MKNLFKSSMLVAIVASAFTGCSKDATSDIGNIIPANTVTVKFGASVEETRATLTPNDAEDAFAAAWEENTDKIGVRVYSTTLEEETDSNAIGTWKSGSFDTVLDDYGKDTYTYNAYYPYTNNNLIAFGSERVQYGNKYNSQYDIMISETVTANGEIGKDANGNAIVFPMKRQTAIAYFHFTTTDANVMDEKLVSATLTVNAEAVIAAESVMQTYYGDMSTPFLTEGDSNVIKITFDSKTAPTAENFTAWFNVLPCTFTSMMLELETENHTATISRKVAEGDNTYVAGNLYKLSVPLTKWKAKVVEVAPDDTVLWSENWNDCKNDAIPNSNTNGTIVYKNATITYSYVNGDTGTKTRVFRDVNSILANGSIPELLLAKSNGKWIIDNIPTGNCSDATLKFKCNHNTDCKVSSSTNSVSVATPVYTYNPFTASNGNVKDAYIVEYPISFTESVISFNLVFENNSKDTNIRIDDIELVVGKKLPKAGLPTKLTITQKDDGTGSFSATWTAAEGVSEYAWRLTTTEDPATDVQKGTTPDTAISVSDLDVAKQYVLYVKSVGDGTNYTDSEEAHVNVSFGGSTEPETYDIELPKNAPTNGQKWSVDLTLDNTYIGKINAIKFGTSSKSSTWQFTALSGTIKIRLYALGWNGKTVSIKLTPKGGSDIVKSINSNSSVSGSKTEITLNTTTKDALHEISLPAKLTQDTDITITDNGSDHRFLLWGVQGVK